MSLRNGLMVFCLCLLTGCATTEPGEMGPNPADSQYSLGVSYLLGQGVPQSDTAAATAFQHAAMRGNPYAQSQLAFLYAAGRGVKRDYSAAIHWYQLAADHGLASAQYNLGLMVAHGIGTPVDEARANELFKQAAEHGFDPARKALAG